MNVTMKSDIYALNHMKWFLLQKRTIHSVVYFFHIRLLLALLTLSEETYIKTQKTRIFKKTFKVPFRLVLVYRMLQ